MLNLAIKPVASHAHDYHVPEKCFNCSYSTMIEPALKLARCRMTLKIVCELTTPEDMRCYDYLQKEGARNAYY